MILGYFLSRCAKFLLYRLLTIAEASRWQRHLLLNLMIVVVILLLSHVLLEVRFHGRWFGCCDSEWLLVTALEG